MILSEEQKRLLAAAQSDATPEQLIWLSGYLYGLANENGEPVQTASPLPASNTVSFPEVTVLYASQTGNAAGVAQRLHDHLHGHNIPVEIHNMLDYRPKNLKKASHILIVASTYGDGEAPDEALSFYNTVISDKAPDLAHISYAVFGLGDSSYELFCQTAIDFDTRFEALGANRLLDRVEGDVDYEEDATQWINAITNSILDTQPETVSAQVAPATSISSTTWSEGNPFQGELLNIINLTDDTSDKDVWHLEIGIEDSGISYLPGDIVTLIPNNCAELVNALIRQAGLSAQDNVTLKGNSITLEKALTHELDITSINSKWIESYATATSQTIEKDDPLSKLIAEGDVFDIIKAYPPASLTAQVFVDILKPLRGRQYSIASSQSVVEDEVHVTVKQVVYDTLGRARKGVCSNWLADLKEGDSIPLYIKPNNSFKLPTDDSVKIIMIGAGTGVAPFRSFLQEREEQGIKGNSWLFFGEQRFYTDFLYQTEWQKLVKDGVLENISLAFSRDQEQKIYVQHRIIENAEALYQWLESGAYIYVCGDRNHMAKDVHNAFVAVIAEQGKRSEADAEAYLQDLISQRRYQRDVY